MTIHLRPAELDLSHFLQPGDRIVFGQACGEPTTLVAALIAQGAARGWTSLPSTSARWGR